MITLSYDEILGRIREKTGMPEDEIRERVDNKIAQLSGLVSKEGAAHILANELGIKLIEQTSGKLQIKNVLTGMRDVEITGKIMAAYDVRQFNTNGREGKVSSVLVADETGQTRIVLWNTQADLVQGMKRGDVLKIKGGYVRERNGQSEIHLNERGKAILNPEGVAVNVNLPQSSPAMQQAARKSLSEIEGTESSVEVLATLVQIFEPRYYEICHCGKRARQGANGITCEIHGTIKPEYGYVMNAFVDDGTENMRVVFFREQAQRLLGKTNQEMLQYKETPELFEQARNELTGLNVKIRGRPTKNEMFDRMELIAQETVLNPDPEPEIKKLEAELNQMKTQKPDIEEI